MWPKNIFTRIFKINFFVATYRYVGSAPERLFVMTYGMSVRRKRVKLYLLNRYQKNLCNFTFVVGFLKVSFFTILLV